MKIEVGYIEPDYPFEGDYNEYCFVTDDLPNYTEIDLALADLSKIQIESKSDYPFGSVSLLVFIDEKKTPDFRIELDGRIVVLR